MYGNNWIAHGKTIFHFFQAIAADFVDQLLKKCKQHKGPLTIVSELKVLIDAKSPDLKTFFNSIQFYLFRKLDKLKVFKLQRSNIMNIYFIK